MNSFKKPVSTSLKSSSSSIKSREGNRTIAEEAQTNESSAVTHRDSEAQPQATERRASSWVFGWGAKEQNSNSSTDKSPKVAPDQGTQIAADDDTSKTDTTENAIDSEMDSEQNRKPEGWMTWGRKLSKSQNISSESLRKLFVDGKSQMAAQSQQQPVNELISKPKAIITHDTQGKSIEVKNTRSMSWGFWNGTNNNELENNFTEDAILFEPSKPKENRDKSKKTLPTEQQVPNIIVPKLEEVLPQQSLIKKLTNMVSYSPPKHLQRTQPKSFKRVLIVGVHGFFPNKMLRPLIGEPTGTSVKFANEAELAVLKWAKKYNLDISIQKIALEKEGRIFDRVEYFFEVMKKWKDEIAKSDFIFFACHSQGTPVTISLLSKLIQSGIIDNDKHDKKIGVLAMAGVNNGPYYGVDQSFFVKAYSTIEHDSMKELFELQNFESAQSKKYLENLRIIISNNTKICFVGSIDDQLIPLYSAIASHVEHPNIYRACYIDGGSNTPTFVLRVVALSLWLKNIGLTDHGIIKEISNSLAGPLTGGGHSKIYNDPNVYELAINFTLGTNDLNVSNPQAVHFSKFDINDNPYHLPWCMRGLVFEVYKNLPRGKEQIEQVSSEFDLWKPESKVLKDLKYRLSAIKAKL